jgi:HAD superfamily hydrolase (TIGR01458 family)
MIAAAGLLIDLDGVLYVEDDAIPGAVEAVDALRDRGVPLRFVTNTTSRPRAAIVERLARLGFAVTTDEVVTPAALAVAVCRRRGHERVALLMDEAVKADFAELDEARADVDAVVVGDLGRGFTYDTLNHAFRLVMDGADLIALQKNRFWMTPSGLSLDVGPFVAALEYATSREAHVVGKPSAGFFASVLTDMDVEPRGAAMVGDDVESDIGGALAAGLDAVLVRTGKYREDVVRRSGIEPTLTIDSIADLPRHVRSHPRGGSAGRTDGEAPGRT